MTVSRSTAANNGANGFHVRSSGDMILEHAVAQGNPSSGLLVVGSVGTISNSTFSYNNVGTTSTGSGTTLLTRKNNTFRGNTTSNQLGTVNELTPL
jgi:hypothetical protein